MAAAKCDLSVVQGKITTVLFDLDNTLIDTRGVDQKAVDKAKMSISAEGQRCIAFLKSAETDDEKLAALFLVPKLVKAEDCDLFTRRQVLEAVGFSFIKRLLLTTSVPEGCPVNIYRAIATTLLGCFLTVEELANDSKMLDMVPDLMNIAAETETLEENVSLINESIQCLEAISSNSAGLNAINVNGGIEMMIKILQSKKHASKQVLQIIVNLVPSSKENKDINNLLDLLCLDFTNDKTVNKFSMCEFIIAVMQNIPEDFKHFDKKSLWYRKLPCELLNVMSNKLGVQQRQRILLLVSVLLQKFGTEWASTENRKLFDISVNLACVEIRMILENSTYEDALTMCDILVGCYSIVETAIEFLITDGIDLSESSILYKSITEAMNAIIFSLNNNSEQICNLSLLKEVEKLLLYATIRVLGVWLAEETTTLRNEIDGVLPILTTLCTEVIGILNHSDKSVPDLVRFLLPGFSHLVSDEKSRNILLTANIHVNLFNYFKLKWHDFEQKINSAAEICEDPISQVEGCTTQID